LYENQETEKDNSLSELSQDALSKNYRIIRNCWTTVLILQGEYDVYKREVLSYM
jgi:hypothetical protein